ncbi:MAG: sugar phosphate isomerase/epimerase [Candidatus Accumulibacter sp.]|jgi:sugar phosphate isomerase/epimerase|nr:sugar phosphate isomerase/epimerase [Accumulibacter sp.]
MAERILSVSGAPYDGYEFPEMLESLAACGVTHVEPAFIVGYTEPFDESAFTEAKARQSLAWLRDSGLACHVFSSHIDLGREDAIEVFKGRMDFAARLGARFINTNAAARANGERFFRNIEALARHAERLGMIICLENPGDGSDNLINTAADGIALLNRLKHDRIRLNYDAANTISHRPFGRPGGVVPADDALLATPYCGHAHIKDARVTPAGYFFVPLGEGDIGCERILRAVAAQTDLDISIEIPLRLHRSPNAQPIRRAAPVPRAEIETVVRAALAFVQRHLEDTSDPIAGDAQ